MSDATSNASPEAKPETPPVGVHFTDDFKEQEKRNYTEAAYRAYYAICNALDSVQTSANSDEYSKWFQAKSVDPGDREELRGYVINGYSNMSYAFGRVNYTKNKQDCKGNVFAWSIRLGPITEINLCDRALSDGPISDYISKSLEWGRGFIVVHEISHIKFNTEDEKYDWNECADLAKHDPGKAVTNAQNYALFAMKLSPPFGRVISLCAGNGKYLSIKQDGSLRADKELAEKEKVGEQEKFAVVDAGGFFFSLKGVSNNRYVTTDANGLLTASAEHVADAQNFRWLDMDHGTVAFRSMRNKKLVSFKTDNGSFADPPAPFAIADVATPRETFKFNEVGLRYRRIKVSVEGGRFLGYLDMKDSAYREAVLQSNADVAHRYKWHKGGDPFTGRLDQKTSPDNRSFTYGTNGNYPCWGLADNWIWLFWDEDTHQIWQDKNQKGRTLCYNGKDLCLGGTGNIPVRLEFDPEDPGID